MADPAASSRCEKRAFDRDMYPKSSYRFSTIPNLLAGRAQKNGTAPALKSDSGERLSYQKLNERVCKLADQLRSFGLGRRARVAIVLPNGLDMAVTLLAVTSTSIAAPLNPSYQEAEFHSYLDEIRVDCIITGEGDVSPARAAARSKGVPVVELAADGVTLSASAEMTKSADGRDGLLRGDVHAGPNPDDTALILLTSGSTGRSKRVPLTHRNLCASVADVCHSLQLGESDRCLCMWEQYHIGGVTDLLLAPLASGGEIICTGGFDAEEFFPAVDDLAPTWFQGVPTTLHEILAIANKTGRSPAKTSLRFIRSVASALPPQLMERIEEFFRAPVVQTYGMTEAGPLIASNPLPPEVRKAGSTGPSCGTLISVRGPNGEELAPLETGQIFVKGENVVAGYEGDDEESKWRDDWFFTGDTGYLDNDGYLFLKGRTKLQINRGGEKVDPQEIDDVLLAHPEIEQAASFSVKHPTLGEDVGVAVVVRHGSSLDSQAVRRLVAGQLSDFKVPRTVLMLPVLPRSAIGKVNREALTALAESQSSEVAYEPPETDLQKVLVKIWVEELGVQRVGLDDDFANLGGDSLSYVRLFLAIERLLGVSLDSAELDQNLTVRQLAIVIEALPNHREILDAAAELGKNLEVAQSAIEKVLSGAAVASPDREQLATAKELRESLLKCDTASEFDALRESFYSELTPNELAALASLPSSSSDGPQRHEQRFLSVQNFIKEHVVPVAARQSWRRQSLSPCVRFYSGENNVEDKKTLIVGFAGHLFRLMMPLWTVLSQLNPADTALLLLWDPERNHYSGGIPGLSDDFPGLLQSLNDIVAKLQYRRVVGFGTSAGGLPALCAGLANEWDSTVSINATYPLTKKHMFPVLKSLSDRESVSRRPKMRLYYSEHNPGDLMAAVAIAKIAKGEVRPLVGHVDHSHVLWAAYERGELPRLFSEFFA